MAATTIEWTDHTVSPIRARSKATGKVFHFCERVSPGCANCYAATMAQRFGLPDYIKANRDKVEFFLDESKLREVLSRKKPTKYFWEDCSDLFGDWVPDEWLHQCFHTMENTPQHIHQILTKRAKRMHQYLIWRWGPREDGNGCRIPASNIWAGVSVEDQKRADERIPLLLETPAAVRFLSVEPLLRKVDLSRFLRPAKCSQCGCTWDFPACGPTHAMLANDPGIHWVIAGGESGHNARPCNVQWIRSLVEQCGAAGVPVFVKQDSGRRPRLQGQIPDDIWQLKEFPDALQTARRYALSPPEAAWLV